LQLSPRRRVAFTRCVCVGAITLLSAWVFRHLDAAPAVRAPASQGAGR